MRYLLLFVVVWALGLILLPHSLLAQAMSQAPAPLAPAYGVRAGVGEIFHDGKRTIIDAYYDVPMGDILFCPEVIYYQAANYAYGFNLKFKAPIAQGRTLAFYGDAGIQFMVWLDRAHVGIPMDLAVTYRLTHALALEATANYTPLFFLGGEPGRGLLSILAGIRITVE